jgi:hypothetical protein
VLREDVTGARIPVTPLRAHNTFGGITPFRQLRLVAAQHIVRVVVDDVRTPVQEESTPVFFVIRVRLALEVSGPLSIQSSTR